MARTRRSEQSAQIASRTVMSKHIIEEGFFKDTYGPSTDRVGIMFGQKQVQLVCWMLVMVFSFGNFAFANNSSVPIVSSQPSSGPDEAINRLCTEEGNNKISATYNRTIYDRRGVAGICLYGVIGRQSQLQREVVGCLYKTSSDPVCAGNNNTNPCTAVGATEIINGTTQKTHFVTSGWGYTTYVVAFKFQLEGHFYPVKEDICWHIWNTSKVQVSNSSVTLPVTTPSKSVPTEADNSSEILLVSSTVSSSAHTEGEGSLTSGESNSIRLGIGLSIPAGVVLGIVALFCWMYKARAGCFKSCDGRQQMPMAMATPTMMVN